jgi:uncharacterized repeat protein (TIGR03833 family)
VVKSANAPMVAKMPKISCPTAKNISPQRASRVFTVLVRQRLTVINESGAWTMSVSPQAKHSENRQILIFIGKSADKNYQRNHYQKRSDGLNIFPPSRIHKNSNDWIFQTPSFVFSCKLRNNHNRMNGRERKNIKPGLRVAIVLKEDQRTGKRTIGIVKDLLTNSPNHPHGIKVRLTDGKVGRVQEILEQE